MISARIVADSINPNGNRITTVECEYPRAIHCHILTHRVFSRNSASSRAIPTRRIIAGLLENYWKPYIGENKKGMQAGEEITGFPAASFRFLWKLNMLINIGFALAYQRILGVHKEVANRVLEPFEFHRVLITSTEWDNFFYQRIGGGAQHETDSLAAAIQAALAASTPKALQWGEWHIPYDPQTGDIDTRINRAVARCARGSSYDFLGEESTADQDRRTLQKLSGGDNGKPHPSPFEHVAQAQSGQWNNFMGFRSYRHRLGI
jgi:hypothetical protein